jgi:hypothetical protein
VKLLSIQVGLPREVMWQGRSVTTGIFKERVEGAVMLRTLNLDGTRKRTYRCMVDRLELSTPIQSNIMNIGEGNSPV